MITDDQIYPLLDEAQSIASWMKSLVFLARDMSKYSDDLADCQKPAIEHLKMIKEYTEALNKKCVALLPADAPIINAEQQQVLTEWTKSL